MRVIQLDFADPEFPASLVEVDPPELPGAAWARVQVTGGGVCGSDLHLFKQTVGMTPELMPYVGIPMQLGHEISGVVIEAGPECAVAEGTRVAIDPVVACEARGIDPLCPQCATGRESVCENLSSRKLTPGMVIGYTTGLGSGWADEVVAHGSMLHRIPSGVSDRAAVLHEPLSISIHGILGNPPCDGEPAVVIGAGIIGLAAVAALRALFPASEVAVIAKHPHQQGAALRMGAHEVVVPEAGGGHIGRLAEIAGTSVVGGGDTALLAGGFPYVIEAVGTAQAITEALRYVGGRGTVLLLGAAGISQVDLTPVWFKEAALAGSYCHGNDPYPAPGGSGSDASAGEGVHSIDRALELLASGAIDDSVLITHEFALSDYRKAVETGLGRADEKSIKVVLRP